MEKPVAIILGGTVPHGELIKQLKQRGYYTILVDYFDNPPAAEFADEHSKESAMDYDAVLKIAKERNASIIMSPCLDQQMVIAMKVSEELQLPHPFSSDTALKVTNKKYMKKIMLENAIPTSRYCQVRVGDDLDHIDLEYPLIVKPTDNCGSAGVTKIWNEQELSGAVENACKWSRTSEAVIEEFKQGVEVSVYCYIKNGKATVIETSTRISKTENDTIKCYCTVSPANVSSKAYENMGKIADQIASAFGLENTPMFYQAIVQGDQVSVIEFSPRIGGGLSYRTMQLNAKFDMINASINAYLGEDTVVEPRKENSVYFIHYIYGKDGIFDHLDGYQALIDKGIIDEVYLLKLKGMSISSEKASSSRTVMFLIHGSNSQECLQKLQEAWKDLDIKDPNGQSLKEEELCLSESDLL